MAGSRLSIALDQSLLALPEAGGIAVLRALAGSDYSGLPRDRLQLANSNRVTFDRLATLGYDVQAQINGRFTTSLVEITRSKVETLGQIATACELTDPGGLILVDGSKTDGIDSVYKQCRAVLETGGVIAKAHGKLFWMRRPDVLPALLADWQRAAAAKPNSAGFVTAPGMFSPDKVDPGSALLAAHFDARVKGAVADLGAGWGWLGAQALARGDVRRIDLFEAEKTALDAARQNLPDARAGFHWVDVTTMPVAEKYDSVIANPPFHQSRAADPSLGIAFISKAADILSPKGQLWLVANRHLPYEATLDLCFGHVKPLEQTPHFKLFLASKPRIGSARKPRADRIKSR